MMPRRFFLHLCSLVGVSAAGNFHVGKMDGTDEFLSNPEGLKKFFDALGSISSGARKQPVRILHFGDSHVAADILTAEIRNRFQSEYGNAGPGFIIPRNPFSTPRRNVLTGASAGWRIDGIGSKSSAEGRYGLAGICLSATDLGEALYLETRADHFEAHFLKQPGGGSIDVLLDEKSVLTKPLSLADNDVVAGFYPIDAAGDTVHRVEIRTLSGNPVRIFGLVAERKTPGIVYDVLGINGARASRMPGWDDTVFSAEVASRNPDLIVLSYGTNEVTDIDWTVNSYTGQTVDIIRLFHRAAPGASIIVSGPPDRSVKSEFGWRTAERMSSLIKAQRTAAFESDAAFWDCTAAMGGHGSMNQWVNRGLAQPDHVHFTRAGYLGLADQFFDALMAALRLYKPA